MSDESRWTCDGCRREYDLRKIDSHRWVNQTANASGECLDKDAPLQLCPSCQVRLLPDSGANWPGG